MFLVELSMDGPSTRGGPPNVQTGRVKLFDDILFKVRLCFPVEVSLRTESKIWDDNKLSALICQFVCTIKGYRIHRAAANAIFW